MSKSGLTLLSSSYEKSLDQICQSKIKTSESFIKKSRNLSKPMEMFTSTVTVKYYLMLPNSDSSRAIVRGRGEV